MNKKKIVRLHNACWWLGIICFIVAIGVSLAGYRFGIYLYGIVFIISLIIGKLKRMKNV